MKGRAQEDYLRAIYFICEKSCSDEIHPVDIQRYLKVSKPSVSEMIKKLAGSKLVIAKRYGVVKLTKKGLHESTRITSKHRIIEVFLSEVLKIKGARVHDEAHRLEHAFSDESVRAIFKIIKKKDVCPHGSKIPKGFGG